MALTITVDDRDFDVENITRMLVIPAAREYVARLTVDRPSDAQITFDGDVRLVELGEATNVLFVVPWRDGKVDVNQQFAVDVADIRRIEFY